MTVLEVARLAVRPGSEDAFEEAFAQAAEILYAAAGQLTVDLTRATETSATPGAYVLLVSWRELEDHVVTFVGSASFQTFLGLLTPHLAAPPQVAHYELLPEDLH